MYIRYIIFLLLCCITCYNSTPAENHSSMLSSFIDNAEFYADNIVLNEDNKIEMIGNINIKSLSNTLSADKIVFDPDKDLITASGHVVLSSDGNVLEAENIELDKHFKYIALRNAKLRMQAGTEIHGKFVSWEKATEKIILKNACFSSCNNPEKSWFVLADKITLNQKTQSIVAKNAEMYLYNHKLIKLPFFIGYTKKIKKKTGLLLPRIGANSFMGGYIKTPLFLNFASNMDATITPTILHKKAFMYDMEFRHLLPIGSYNAHFYGANKHLLSGEYEKKNYYIYSSGYFDLKKGAKIQYNAHKLYNDDFFFVIFGKDANYLFSDIKFIASAEDYYFEAITMQSRSMSNDTSNKKETLLPMLRFMYRPYAKNNVDWTVDVDQGSFGVIDKALLGHKRLVFSNNIKATLPPVPFGIYSYLNLNVLNAFYKVDDRGRAKDSKTMNLASISYNARYKIFMPNSMVVTPIAHLKLLPYRPKEKNIVNIEEIDRQWHINEHNIFSDNYSYNKDILDTSERVSYGIKVFGYKTDVTIGQTFYFNDDIVNNGFALFKKHSTDSLIAVRARLKDYNVISRYKTNSLKEDTYKHFEVERDFKSIGLAVGYVDANQLSNAAAKSLIFRVSLFEKNIWKVMLSSEYNLKERGGLRALGMKFVKEDECHQFNINFEYDSSIRIKGKARTNFWVGLTLKT